MKTFICNYFFWLLLMQYLLVYVFGKAFDFFDKIFVVLGMCAIVFKTGFLIKKIRYASLFFVLIIVGLLGNCASGYFRYEAILNDLFLFSKFPVAFCFGYIVAKKIKPILTNPTFLRKKIYVVGSVIFLLCLINYFFPIFPVLDMYSLGPIKCLSLFFGHPTFLCGTMIFYLSLFLFVFQKKSANIVLLIMMLSTLITTTRMKGILTVIIVSYMILKFKKMRAFSLKWYDLLLTISVACYVAFEKFIFYFVQSANYARGLIFFNSIELARMYAPLGAGLGSFASSGSVKYLSPFYYKMGMYNETKFFESDSFLATIFAQTGFLGMFVFAIFLYLLVKKTYDLRSCPNAFVSAAVIVVYLSVSCIAEVSFFAVYSVPMTFWLGVLFRNYSPQNR